MPSRYNLQRLVVSQSMSLGGRWVQVLYVCGLSFRFFLHRPMLRMKGAFVTGLAVVSDLQIVQGTATQQDRAELTCG